MKTATRQMIELALNADETVEPEVREVVTAALRGELPEQVPVDEQPLLLTMTGAAGVLGVSRVTLWRMVKMGALKPIEIMPGIRRIRRDDLRRVSANYA